MFGNDTTSENWKNKIIYIYITCPSKPFFLQARFCKKVNPEIQKPNDFGGFFIAQSVKN
jgi:hypothetical protein